MNTLLVFRAPKPIVSDGRLDKSLVCRSIGFLSSALKEKDEAKNIAQAKIPDASVQWHGIEEQFRGRFRARKTGEKKKSVSESSREGELGSTYYDS